MTVRPVRVHSISIALLVVATAAIAFRSWTSFCFFPLPEWNSVRLAPTFMLEAGVTPYPTLDHGPLTTWIYGPAMLLLNLPAVVAHDMVVALFIAGGVTLLLAAVPAAISVSATAGLRTDTTRTDQVWAWLLCLAIWPNPSLQYIQADNAAVAFGLLANAALTRTRAGQPFSLLLAAGCAALAIWSKQTAVGLILAQVLWLGFARGHRIALRYAFTVVMLAVLLSAGFVAWFGFEGLWLNLVQIPGRLPFCESVLAYSRDFWPELSGYVFLPAIACVIARRTVWRRESIWLLPALSWLCLLPMGLTSLYHIGGATNSLNGVLYLLPTATLAAVVALRKFSSHRAAAWLAASVIAICTQQLASTPLVPLRPLTTHLVEAEQLARQFPGRIYFPWHPLATFFSEGRFYHAEDGLYTRSLAALGRDPKIVRTDLPIAWSITAIPGWRTQGVFKQFQPADAPLGFVGKWALYRWPAPATPSAPR